MNGILKSKINVSLLFLLIVSSIISCKKYPADTGMHLYRTAKNRLVGTWLVKEYLLNGADATGAYNDLNPALTFTIKRNGEYLVYCDGFMVDKTGIKNPYITNVAGTWQFLDKKKKIALTQGTFSSNIDNYEILKLTKTELWLRQQNGITTAETHYIIK